MKPKFQSNWGPEEQAASVKAVAGRRKPGAHPPRGLIWALLLIAICGASRGGAQSPATSVQDKIATALVAEESSPASASAARKWDRATALRVEGMADAWYNTANGDDYGYVKQVVDAYVEGALTPRDSLPPDAAMGSAVLLMHRVTLHANYYEAAQQLRDVAATHCGIGPKANATGAGCEDAPFLAEFASVFQDPGAFGGITDALVRWDGANRKSRDAGGEAREAKAIVDSLQYYPEGDAGRAVLVKLLSRIAAKESATSSAKAARGSLEATARDCLLAYALMKGARLGYLPEAASERGKQLWMAVRARAFREDAKGKLDLDADAGVMLLAATEAEHAATAFVAHGKTAVVDAWFNSQERKNAAGQMESFHYKWSDEADSGYALLGHMLQGYGVVTRALPAAPTAENLRGADYYFIASPDIPVKNPNPHYMTDTDAAAVVEWVKQGGVLVMMENDPPNADIEHLNLLADRFGIHFDNVLHHHILGVQVADGTIPVTPDGVLFKHAHTLYMKDTCAISLNGTGEALLRDRGDIVMAAVKYGRGTVFAAVDPWVYNEYTDGRKNAKIYGQFDNFAGGMELVRWLVEQRPQTGAGVEGSKSTHP